MSICASKKQSEGGYEKQNGDFRYVFRDIIEKRHDFARQWKARTGRKVIGYFCSYIPEEIAYAAGVLPVRILSSEEPPIQAARYMAQWTCPFSRSCLHQALKGEYNYLDALIFPFTCFHTHSAFYYWSVRIPETVSYRIDLPKVLSRTGTKAFFIEELKKFRYWLERFTNLPISNEDLERGIDVVNTNRRLMKKVYRLRKDVSPHLTGVEAMEMVLSSQLMPKEDHNKLVAKWLEVLPKRLEPPERTMRVMVVGSHLDKPEMLQLIEDQGINVVIDDLCIGTRYFWDEVVQGLNPLSVIADRYLNRINCPAKTAGDRRYRHILNLASEFRVEGIIVVHQKFCNPHGNDYAYLKELFDHNNIPHLLLELDIPIPGGQIRNRVQTLVEMFKLEEAERLVE